MKTHLERRRVSSLRSAHLSAILLLAASLVPRARCATPPAAPVASAASIRGAHVMVNGAPMIPGATLFPGDVVRVGEDSTAALQFGASLVAATPVTEFVVETRGVNLRSGRLQVRASGNERIAVFGPFFSVDISPLGSTPSAAEIRLGGARAQISAVSGVADLTAAGNANSYKLHAGETATLDADSGDPRSPQGNVNQPAGQVARLYPGVRVDRSSQRFASVFDPVLWNDDFQSDRTGRAHLALNDGSQLNLGSDTTLRVLQHDAQAQQTSLDLIIGRMRGVVAKVTRPGGKFEIRTPVGVAGLVGTDFSLLVTNDYVELMVFDGAVAMTLFSNGRVVTVNAGMKVRFPRNGAVEIPSTATPQEMDLAKSLTDVPETAAGGPPAPGGVRPLLPVVVALASGAAVTGVAIWLDMRERKPVSPPNP